MKEFGFVKKLNSYLKSLVEPDFSHCLNTLASDFTFFCTTSRSKILETFTNISIVLFYSPIHFPHTP